jgi:hypothetical protein
VGTAFYHGLLGGSVEANASATVKTNVIPAKGEVTVEGTAKIEYDYTDNSEEYDTHYGSRTETFSGQTNADDYLVALYQTFDIWRYRVYGVTPKDGSATNLFYEIVLPGPQREIPGGGLDVEWYQPRHENGNILSYPQLSRGTFTPEDMGSFRLKDGTMKSEPLIRATQQSWAGTSGGIELVYDDGTTATDTHYYDHKLSESLDVKATAKGEAGIFGNEAEVEASLAVNVHNSNSWGNTSVSESSSTGSKGLTLVKPPTDTTRGYFFAPVFYITRDGTVKVTHAVDMLTHKGGKTWWASHYGRQPDPALNLPFKFRMTDNSGDNWVLNTESNRKTMRGFFLRDAEVNEVTGERDYLDNAPTDGDEVEIVARVYNYSTAAMARGVKVLFQIVEYDDATDTEIGERSDLGSVNVSLNPREMKEVSIPWDTTGWGHTNANVAVAYRLYVVLDPDGQIDEIHDLEDEWVADEGNSVTGGNNEGFGYVYVYPAGTGHSSEPADYAANWLLDENEPDIHMRDDSVAVLTPEGVLDHGEDGSVTVYAGEHVRLRVAVYTDETHADVEHVLVFDGDPNEGGRLIAGKMAYGVDTQDGTHVWVDWTPMEAGEHHIYAEVIERVDDADPGDATDLLKVNVIERSDETDGGLQPQTRAGELCGIGILWALLASALCLGVMRLAPRRRRR